MDVLFPDESALAAQWKDSCGVLGAEEWRAWLPDARDDELNAIAVERGPADDDSLADRARDTLGL